MSGTEKQQDNQRLPWERLPTVAAGRGFQMLSNYRVLDLTTSIAGPYATMLLSDFGAEIIKLERPTGDDARTWGPPFLAEQSLWFTAVNRNKKSVVLDLKEQEGRKHFDDLVRSADVLICNQTLNVQKKLGIDYESMQTLNPELIFVAITGFGLTGERANLACYDLIAEGYSGIMDLTGEADSPPQKIGAPAADMLAGQDAALAVMAALIDRQSTGQGCKIDVSLAESMTRFLTCRISSYLGSGEVPTRSGGTDSVIAIYQAFDTKDEPITLGLGSDAIWKRFWEAVGQPKYAEQSEFASNAQRREHRGQIVSTIQNLLRQRSRNEWLKVFEQFRVPAGPLNRLDEVAHDAAFQERGLFYTLQDGNRRVPQVGLGIRINDQPAIPRSAPPILGQHTDEILKQQTTNGRQEQKRGSTRELL